MKKDVFVIAMGAILRAKASDRVLSYRYGRPPGSVLSADFPEGLGVVGAPILSWGAVGHQPELREILQ